ncbi:MAG: Phosphoglucosamine mutase [Alphaproteobacteria bacterium MarineAlpha5_Bin5]|nr:MAG: Phosphoglucosamine mutase [Alphaproteobacteria bacterium MarineAlpha5_Bin5]PPR52579.1 MAG: Phosphoglucosamine mutase [Alphaproteobacteria bacterium MarineAlpha5_Bin4]
MAKIFGTDGIRCLVNKEPLSAETTLKIAKTVGHLLKSKKNTNSRVVISKDTRLSGYLYEPLITAGFVSMGMDVILVGPLPTPAVPLLIKTLRADLGVMITASHNTYEYNGLKFFDSQGFKLSTKIENKVEEIVLNNTKYSKIINLKQKSGKAIRLEDAPGRYSEFLKSTLDKSIKIKKLKIVLDCANGATYNIAPNLFWELGHTIVTINNNPNGININKNCGAVDINELKNKVTQTNSDIGFAFDGDGDRLIVVNEKGDIVDGDMIIALFSKFIVNEKIKSKFPIVSTVMANMGLEEYLKNNFKIKLKRTSVGDINVINTMKKNKSKLGGEQSGHIILSDYSNAGDGILAALKITEHLSVLNSKTSDAFNIYESVPQIKINISFKSLSKKNLTFINKISKDKSLIKKNMRSLIRISGTEPLIRILVEGKNFQEVESCAKLIEKKIRLNLAK